MKKFTIDIKRKIFSFLSSIILHLMFLVLIFIAGLSSSQIPKINRQVFILESNQINNNSNLQSEKENLAEHKIPQKFQEEIKNQPFDNNVMTFNPDDIIADTTDLEQIYSENTLNVSIKYPKGWTYIDQTNKNKLDGVTFWSIEGIYNPPPYIHLEVVEKYLFSSNRYKYKVKQQNCEWYFNEPEKLENYISQEIYIRTEDDEDFLIKLIMVGEEQFYQFQPKFFAIVKSFDFGKNFF